ncbi:hypothetical protein PUN28_010440 [Cardiocondyla obscurior]|uniref:Uncharacterized protein n=1 Tax=Cardiocondyla obscurior TaxID=286306 RepID=A0AAW2FHG4_9HYME
MAFCNSVMYSKEENEREREQQALPINNSFSPSTHRCNRKRRDSLRRQYVDKHLKV